MTDRSAPDLSSDLHDEAETSASERRCIVSGESGPKAGLLRFVISPDGVVTPDVREKLPGRGIWVTCDRVTVEQAMAKKLFARAARRQVIIPDNLLELIEKLLLQQPLQQLSMACKAGQLCFGTDTVESSLAKDQLHAIVQADDAADNALKLAHQWEKHLPVLRFAGRDALSAALGRNNLVHIGVKSSIVAARLQAATARFIAFSGPQTDHQRIP